MTQMESDLRNLVGPARFLTRAQTAGVPLQQFPGSELAGFNDPAGRVYFASWGMEGEELTRSLSLGEHAFSRPLRFTSVGEMVDIKLANGDTVRALAVRLPSGRPRGPLGSGGPPEWIEGSPRERGPRPPFVDEDRSRGRPPGRPAGRMGREGGGPAPNREYLDVIVAKSRRRVDETLKLVLGGIAAAGLGAALASMLLMRLALASGLRPLYSLGEQTAAIDAGSLDHRFGTDGLPAELRPIGARLNELMARLQQGFERERRFGADLAHELRTPVAELRSMAEVAMKWPDQVSAENYGDLLNIASRMQGTIENLLRLARLENSAASPEASPVALLPLLEEAWKPFASLAARRKLKLRFAVPTGVAVNTDAEMLRTIVSNLFSNAAEYAREDSEIVAESGGGATLAVENDAPGLDEVDLPHLFERLWRLDRSRTSGSHSGLGLALAKACAEALGFKIEARLKAGRLRIELRRIPDAATA